jgi:hypothetical protein
MDIGFVMGFKRLILKTVMKINRAQTQRKIVRQAD